MRAVARFYRDFPHLTHLVLYLALVLAFLVCALTERGWLAVVCIAASVVNYALWQRVPK